MKDPQRGGWEPSAVPPGERGHPGTQGRDLGVGCPLTLEHQLSGTDVDRSKVLVTITIGVDFGCIDHDLLTIKVATTLRKHHVEAFPIAI